MFSSDVAVQTENVVVTAAGQSQDPCERQKDDDQLSTLSAQDLGSILKWSKEISSDINLTIALQRLTEIATGKSPADLFILSDAYRFRREFWQSKYMCRNC